jgi:metal-responsive CopG/Arc/MetJ family transcriptional regulator
MKVKTSVTLSEEVLREMEELISGSSRSAFIEAALRAHLDRLRRRRRDARDAAILERAADRLEREAADVLAYQVDAIERD